MTNLDQRLFKEVVDFLIPFMGEGEREKWLRLAFDERICSKLNFKGAAGEFTPRVTDDLIRHGEVLPGKQAIIVLLEVMHGDLGFDRQQVIETIQHKLVAHFNAGAAQHRFPTRENFVKTEEILPSGDLLPYMVNREDQEYRLGRFIQRPGAKQRTPVVCLIYGDEFQCHEMFLERLKFVSLPRLLDLRFQQNTILPYLLHWPTRFQDMAELHDKLRKHLADEICGYSSAGLNEINDELSRNPAPVLVHTHLCTEDWQRHGLNAVRGFLEFWRQWPPLKSSQHVVVCLCIKYKAQTYGKASPLLARLFLSRATYSNLAALVEQALGTLDYTQFDPLVCAPLPKLEDVTITEVENWARSKETHALCRHQNLLVEIRAIFAEWEIRTKSTTIPMEIISPKLEQLLAKHRR